MSVLRTCVCTIDVPDVIEGQEIVRSPGTRVTDGFELHLWMQGTEPGLFGGAVSVLNH